jgi:wobble nucleotide-excising tRNase
MIKKINKINNFGIFQGFRWPTGDELPVFKEKNVFYGWNGTGKFTLATLLGLLEKKIIENKYTEKPAFEIELEDGSKITQNNLQNSPTVRVFDEDFVSENIDWSGKAKPIFFVGVENIKLSKELDIKQKLYEDLKIQRTNKTTEKDKIEKRFLKWKKKLANRTIKDALNTGHGDKYTNYDTPKLESTINSTTKIDRKTILIDEEKAILNKKIQQSSLPKIPKIVISADTKKLINDTNSILKKTAISNTLDRLKEEKETETWVKNGLKLHKENEFSECKFCGRPLTDDILKELNDHFNNEYQLLSNEIEIHKTSLKNAILDINLPQKNEFDLELRSQFYIVKNETDDCIIAFNKIISELLLKIKSKTPIEKVAEYFIDEKNETLQKAKKVNDTVTELNELITDHNQKVDNFDKEILKAKKKIELSIIAENITDYRNYENQIQNLSNEITELYKQYSPVQKRILEIEASLSDVAKAVKQINNYLKDYLGRDEIQIEFNDQEKGFYIKRGDIIASNLSEGERTGIAFIYFLTKLEEKKFDKSHCIVVIDDPVSSLDSNSLYFAFAFLKEKLRDVHQLFILTHTFDFLRQIKNWFYQIQRNDGKNKADCFMTDCYWETDKRKAKIKPLDKLLTDYQSEYHYLLKILIDLSKDSEPDLEKVYNYPNITRKFLEIFLSFKYPHKQKLYNKMQELVSQNVINEHTQIGISLFINELSHDFYEDRTEIFNMSHLFSAKEVAEKVIKIVQKIEPEQYKMLI